MYPKAASVTWLWSWISPNEHVAMLETVAEVFQAPVAFPVAAEDQLPPNVAVQSAEVLSVVLRDRSKAELER
jgi:hypothetical protein